MTKTKTQTTKTKKTLLDSLLIALSQKYKKDGTKPAILVSYIKPNYYYIAAKRYVKGVESTLASCYSSTSDDKALYDLALCLEWVIETKKFSKLLDKFEDEVLFVKEGDSVDE